MRLSSLRLVLWGLLYPESPNRGNHSSWIRLSWVPGLWAFAQSRLQCAGGLKLRGPWWDIGLWSSSSSPVFVLEALGWGLGGQMQGWRLGDGVSGLAGVLEAQGQSLRLHHESLRAGSGEEQ